MQLTDKIRTKINEFYKGKHTSKKKKKGKKKGKQATTTKLSVSLREKKNNFWFGKIKKCL